MQTEPHSGAWQHLGSVARNRAIVKSRFASNCNLCPVAGRVMAGADREAGQGEEADVGM